MTIKNNPLKPRIPDVSIIVPCFNEEKTIQLLLNAILSQTYPKNRIEVVIADADSNDLTRIRIREFVHDHPVLKITVVNNPAHTIPAGVNAAAGNARGEYLIRLDAHSVPACDYVERCVQDIREGKGACVGGVWDIQPGGTGWMAIAIAVAAANPFAVGDALYRYTTSEREVDTVPFGAFTKTLFNKVGGFDETLLTNEDYEFYARIRKNGGRIWLDPAIRCIYYARPTLLALAYQYWRYGYWKFRMLERYPHTLRWRQALPPLFVLSVLLFSILSFFVPIFRILLISLLGVYLATLLLVSVTSAIRKRDFSLILGMSLAIATMHFFWGTGLLYSMIAKIIFRK